MTQPDEQSEAAREGDWFFEERQRLELELRQWKRQAWLTGAWVLALLVLLIVFVVKGAP